MRTNRIHRCLRSKTVRGAETEPDTPCRQRLQNRAGDGLGPPGEKNSVIRDALLFLHPLCIGWKEGVQL